MVRFGLQTANEVYRRKVLKRPESNRRVVEVSEWCHKYELPFNIDHIICLPGETSESLIESARFYNRIRPTVITFANLIYLPNTEIIKKGIEVGDLNVDDIPLINSGRHMTSKEDAFLKFRWSESQGKSKALFLNKITYIFSLISFIPQSKVSKIIESNFLFSNKPLPFYKVIGVKVIAKWKAKELYLYWNTIKKSFLSLFSKRIYFS